MARSVYARMQDLRGIGLTDESKYPDTRLQAILEFASARVEQLTCQWFAPRRLDLIRNGEGRRQVEEPNNNKIIEIEGLWLKSTNSPEEFYVEPRYYHVHDRIVRLRWVFDEGMDIHFHHRHNFNPLRPSDIAFIDLPRRRFPDNDGNVRLRGIFGWIESSEKFETTLAADMPKGCRQVPLTDAGDIEENDVLLIGDDVDAFWVIANSDPQSGAVYPTVAIDPSPKKGVTGAKVIRFGQVPLLIREAVLRTAAANRFLPGSEEEIDNQNARRVRREETDNYEVEFFASPAGDKLASGTGDPLADSILSNFRGPRISARHV